MAQAAPAILNRPVWVDLAAKDPEAARAFYGKLFGWDIQVNVDPQYGGYGRAQVDGQDAAGIGGTPGPDQPSVWTLYIGSDDADALSQRVAAAGGTVAMPAFDVGDQGRMAVFQDPSGAFISTWQATSMGGFQAQGPARWAGPSSTPAASTRRCRSTSRSSAGRRSRSAPTTSRTPSSSSTATASPGHPR